jgi:hypothetical protein
VTNPPGKGAAKRVLLLAAVSPAVAVAVAVAVAGCGQSPPPVRHAAHQVPHTAHSVADAAHAARHTADPARHAGHPEPDAAPAGRTTFHRWWTGSGRHQFSRVARDLQKIILTDVVRDQDSAFSADARRLVTDATAALGNPPPVGTASYLAAMRDFKRAGQASLGGSYVRAYAAVRVGLPKMDVFIAAAGLKALSAPRSPSGAFTDCVGGGRDAGRASPRARPDRGWFAAFVSDNRVDRFLPIDSDTITAMNPLSGVLGEAWQMYRRFAGHLLAIAFVIYLVAAVIAALLGLIGAFGVLLGAIVELFAAFLLQATLVKAVQDVRDGRADLSIGETVSAATPYIWIVAGASILAGIAITIGLILIIVPGLYLITIWAVIVPVIVIEASGVFAAFGRSHQLVRGHGWHVFGTLVLVFIILIVVDIVLGLIFLALPLLLRNGLSTVISGTLIAPFLALVVTLIYYRLLGAGDGQAPANDPPWPAGPGAA